MEVDVNLICDPAFRRRLEGDVMFMCEPASQNMPNEDITIQEDSNIQPVMATTNGQSGYSALGRDESMDACIAGVNSQECEEWDESSETVSNSESYLHGVNETGLLSFSNEHIIPDSTMENDTIPYGFLEQASDINDISNDNLIREDDITVGGSHQNTAMKPMEDASGVLKSIKTKKTVILTRPRKRKQATPRPVSAECFDSDSFEGDSDLETYSSNPTHYSLNVTNRNMNADTYVDRNKLFYHDKIGDQITHKPLFSKLCVTKKRRHCLSKHCDNGSLSYEDIIEIINNSSSDAHVPCSTNRFRQHLSKHNHEIESKEKESLQINENEEFLPVPENEEDVLKVEESESSEDVKETMRDRHVKLVNGDENFLLECKVCLKHFPTPSDLTDHYVGHSMSEREQAKTRCGTTSLENSTVDTGVDPCDSDNECTGEAEMKDRSEDLNHSESDSMTSSCVDSELSGGRDKLSGDVLESSTYFCHLCQQRFSNITALQNHVEDHALEGELTTDVKSENYCSLCQKKFASAGSLYVHNKIHTGENPYTCNTCSKSFRDKTRLTTHIRVHTGEKPYICNVCQKSFSQKGNLKLHQKIHTGERNCVCGVCGNGFRSRSDLVRHMKIHGVALSSGSENEDTCHKPSSTVSLSPSLMFHHDSIDGQSTLHRSNKIRDLLETNENITPLSTLPGTRSGTELHNLTLLESLDRRWGMASTEGQHYKPEIHLEDRLPTKQFVDLEANSYMMNCNLEMEFVKAMTNTKMRSEVRPVKTHACPMCGLSLGSFDAFNHHILLQHNPLSMFGGLSSTLSKHPSILALLDPLMALPKNDRFTCKECNEVFSSYEELSRHTDTHRQKSALQNAQSTHPEHKVTRHATQSDLKVSGHSPHTDLKISGHSPHTDLKISGHSPHTDLKISGHSPHTDLKISGHSPHTDLKISGHSPHTDLKISGHSPHTDLKVSGHSPHTDLKISGHSPHTDLKISGHSPHTDLKISGHSPHTDLKISGHSPHTDPKISGHSPHTDLKISGHSPHTDLKISGHSPHTDLKISGHSPHTDLKISGHSPHTDPKISGHSPHTDLKISGHSPHTDLKISHYSQHTDRKISHYSQHTDKKPFKLSHWSDKKGPQHKRHIDNQSPRHRVYFDSPHSHHVDFNESKHSSHFSSKGLIPNPHFDLKTTAQYSHYDSKRTQQNLLIDLKVTQPGPQFDIKGNSHDYDPMRSQHSPHLTPKEPKHGPHFDPDEGSTSREDGGSSFLLSAAMMDEMKLTAHDKLYSCESCVKTFRRSHHLQTHLRTHTGDRPYTCVECNKCFARGDHLHNHQRTHTGEKPYQCDVCDKTYSQSHHLLRHKRTHTGERPYRCHLCEKTFSRDHHLKKHQESHNMLDIIPGQMDCNSPSRIPHRLGEIPFNIVTRSSNRIGQLMMDMRTENSASKLMESMIQRHLLEEEEQRQEFKPMKILDTVYRQPSSLESKPQKETFRLGDILNEDIKMRKSQECEDGFQSKKIKTHEKTYSHEDRKMTKAMKTQEEFHTQTSSKDCKSKKESIKITDILNDHIDKEAASQISTDLILDHVMRLTRKPKSAFQILSEGNPSESQPFYQKSHVGDLSESYSSHDSVTWNNVANMSHKHSHTDSNVTRHNAANMSHKHLHTDSSVTRDNAANMSHKHSHTDSSVTRDNAANMSHKHSNTDSNVTQDNAANMSHKHSHTDSSVTQDNVANMSHKHSHTDSNVTQDNAANMSYKHSHKDSSVTQDNVANMSHKHSHTDSNVSRDNSASMSPKQSHTDSNLTRENAANMSHKHSHTDSNVTWDNAANMSHKRSHKDSSVIDEGKDQTKTSSLNLAGSQHELRTLEDVVTKSLMEEYNLK